MSTARRRWLAAGLSVALVLVLLLIISLDNMFEQPNPELVTYREIEIQPPPPPPPPPQVASPSRSGAARLDLRAAADSPVELVIGKLDVDVAAGQLTGLGQGDWGEGIGIGFDGFSLDDLDAVPAVIGQPPFAYPEDLTEQGIDTFVVYVHVVIDKEGRTSLIDILENPYPSSNAQLERFVNGIRWTPPTLGGKVVSADVPRWSIKFKAQLDKDGAPVGTREGPRRQRRTGEP